MSNSEMFEIENETSLFAVAGKSKTDWSRYFYLIVTLTGTITLLYVTFPTVFTARNSSSNRYVANDPKSNFAMKTTSYCDRVFDRPLPELTIIDQQYSNVSFPLSSTSTLAKLYFNEGMSLFYAYNAEEALRYFRKALQLDSSLAMAYYGMALAVGTNMNIQIDDACQSFAYAQISKAVKQMSSLSPLEKDLIGSLVVRHPSAHYNNSESDVAYRDAMQAIYAKYPDNPDVSCIYVDSLMNMFPFALWSSEGVSTDPAHTGIVLSVLENGLRQHPLHIGLNHYNIHAREAMTEASVALTSANFFHLLNISAGHLVHMPAHIFMRTGQYRLAATANERAIATDQQNVDLCMRDISSPLCSPIYAAYYNSHNVLFLVVAYTMMRNEQSAVRAATLLDASVPYFSGHGFPRLVRYSSTTILTLERFRRWVDVLRVKRPDTTLQYSSVRFSLYHWARAKAYLGLGHADEAAIEKKLFIASTERISTEESDSWGAVSANDLLAVAALELEASFAYTRNEINLAINLLLEAVAIQDTFPYDEPIAWMPMRVKLGAAFYLAGQVASALEQFQFDLYGSSYDKTLPVHDQRTTPNNPLSLFGLYQCLKATGRPYLTEKDEFAAAWALSDSPTEPTMSDLLF